MVITNTAQRKSEVAGIAVPFSFTSTGGVKCAYDVGKIKSNIYVAITTMYGELFFEPYKGSRLKNLLLEPADNIIAQEIKNEIINVVARTEPRATVLDVVVTNNDGVLTLNIQYQIVGFEVTYTMLIDYFEGR